MRLVTPCLVFVAAAFGFVELAAQAKPKLSGVWVSAGGGAQKAVKELKVKHDDSTLAFDGGPQNKATIKLDGSETKISAPDGRYLLAKASWEGTTLVVTVHDPDISQNIRRQTWTIDSDGQLVTETVFVGPDAIDSSGQPRAPIKEIFKRR
jgi:hypothetical protein